VRPSRTHRPVAFALAAALLLSVVCAAPAAQAQPQAKYIILFIGDGMGSAQRTIAEYYLNAVQPPPEGEAARRLAMNALPIQGRMTTHSRNAFVTDSAASGTAIACGQKTNNGAIATDAQHQPLETIAEIAHRRGMKVGIVTSVSIDHATPACFYAHQSGRSDYYDIAMQLAASGFEYFGGGAAVGATEKYAKGRTDPVAAARTAGYTVAIGRKDILALRPGGGKVWAIAGGLDSRAAMPYEIDRQEGQISLAEITAKGIDLLSAGDEGFFLMVEGGRIDWACHINDAAATVRDVLALDQAVEEALAFYRRHPAETLIIVTADHETGGIALGTSSVKGSLDPARLAGQTMSAERFAGELAPLKKAGQSFAQVRPLIQETFGFAQLPGADQAALQRAYTGKGSLAIACVQLVSRQAGVLWASAQHTAVPVPTSAIGVGAGLFDGCYDNTDIFHKILSVLPPPTAGTAPRQAPAVLGSGMPGQ